MTSFIADILFPKHCLHCGKLGSYICLTCQRTLVVVAPPLCLYCKKPSLHGLTHPTCKLQNGIDGFITVFRYNAVLKQIIKGIKYRLVSRAIPELMNIALPHVMQELHYMQGHYSLVLQPVPLHASRLRQRGFNQSVYIAQCLGDFFSWRIVDLVERTKKTHAQAQLTGLYDRFQNLSDAFAFRKSAGIARHVFIIDDVVTSGSTVKQLARVLKKGGAEKVFAFSLAI